MRYIELLAPARTADIGIEAIRHGADAVYIGGPAFGARQAARNSVEDIARLCDYARPFGARVYVTINTFLTEEELRETEHMIHRLYEIGVSAIIVQDMAITRLALPPIPLHASTQMDNRTPQQVARLTEMGFEQVVLARELNPEQISEIHKTVPDARLEVFVHGALCVGLSGRCNASEYLFGRSANRGACAQVCRLRFDLEDEQGHVLVRDRYLLSLKDMNRSAQLEELIAAGATSFKIEGRLKDLAYVKNITAYYRRALDEIIARHPGELMRSSIGQEALTFAPDPVRSFNRGFTTYPDFTDIFSPFTPKSLGQYVGRVSGIGRDYITVATARDKVAGNREQGNAAISFAAGDGLCYFDAGSKTLQGFRVNSVQGDRLFPRPMPRDIAVGMPIYRNQDFAFDKMLEGNTATRTIPINIILADTPTGFRLTGTIPDGAAASLDVEYPREQARTDQRENIIRQLSRLGDTPYRAAQIDIQTSDNWFIPSSVLATWRRELIARIAPPAPVSKPVLMRRAAEDDELNNHPIAGQPLMQCRHCLRRELGACPHGKHPVKQLLTPSAPITPTTRLFLRMNDGRRLHLIFDCANCIMKIISC